MKTIFAASLIIFTLLVILCGMTDEVIYEDTDSVKWSGEQLLPSSRPDTRLISIPGIDMMVFQAGETTQKVNIYNPETNACNIIFSLKVNGEIIWKSKECAPGNGYYTIETSKPLESGNYDAELFHECIRDGQKLNSANMKINLIVQ